jgi:hypothetical protein
MSGGRRMTVASWEEQKMAGKLGQVQAVLSADQHGHGFTLSGDGSYGFPLTFGFKTEADAKAARKELAKMLGKAVFLTEAPH